MEAPGRSGRREAAIKRLAAAPQLFAYKHKEGEEASAPKALRLRGKPRGWHRPPGHPPSPRAPPRDFMGATMNPEMADYYFLSGQSSPPVSYTGSFFIKTEQCQDQESLFNLMSGILGLSPFSTSEAHQRQLDAIYSVPDAIQSHLDLYSTCQPELNISVQPSLAEQGYSNFSSSTSIHQQVETSSELQNSSQCLFNEKLLDSKQGIKLSSISPSLEKFKPPCSHWEPLGPPQNYLPSDYAASETFHPIEPSPAMFPQLGSKTENVLAVSCQSELNSLPEQSTVFGPNLDFGCHPETFPTHPQIPSDFVETKIPSLPPHLIQDFESALPQPEILPGSINPNDQRLHISHSSMTDFLAHASNSSVNALGSSKTTPSILAEPKKKSRRGKCNEMSQLYSYFGMFTLFQHHGQWSAPGGMPPTFSTMRAMDSSQQN
ncbi:hypothetical protein JD844_026088 [Phrynosoma platyrhinos]|uniref:Endothelial PAS domain protein 1 n=1 Tax=Phrynosoma platyrhinos TaxID=52577 RepID=A0ABQ7SEG6_PHRPL|nr:hypothetical protein JD844_026088 [Phrynosoma platyrhinos]